ncbi:RNA exonuclease 2 [Heterostelium album PN500]|uniref:RNA exonuclease 2 n=1 Tax=Heterostelium pallidum (strain ATCC 26659 / Pp 5 / PN500) TaxID=670386 RepID=D3BSL9_HETP5|nr:RNA exonuclease 2 [Heterostelium album PN500]EFA75484.1 RNA exonuclease 2 [Heterostelium album PN500]|eukprot:XP_020427618.1 RNA exonuclease 2 [Heterostelium album PN500]
MICGNCGCGNHSCGGNCAWAIKQLQEQINKLTQQVTNLESSKITTQTVKVPNHFQKITNTQFTAIPGSQATLTVTRPTKLIAFVSFHSLSPSVLTSCDVTSALNGNVMTLAGYNDYPWPTGTSLNHNHYVNGVSITQEVLQPGCTYNYDIRGRVRCGNQQCDANGFASFDFLDKFTSKINSSAATKYIKLAKKCSFSTININCLSSLPKQSIFENSNNKFNSRSSQFLKRQQQQKSIIYKNFYTSSSLSYSDTNSNYNDNNNKMSSTTNDRANRLIWVDLEMTGLDITKDHIMEMACIITDSELNVVEVGPELIVHIDDKDLNSMDQWCTEHHGQSGLTEKCRQSKLSIQDAEKQMVEFLRKHVDKGQCPLAGNSVHQDKRFLLKEMPLFADMLHYRIVDVSTIKELVRRWYPSVANGLKKRNLHRTLADIEDSIEELKYYRSTVFKQQLP